MHTPLGRVFRLVHQDSHEPAVNLAAEVLQKEAYQELAPDVMLVAAHGRQIPVEADELQLREDPDQSAGQSCRSWMPGLTAEQSLELLTGRSIPVPQSPVQRGERSAETVLQLVHLHRKA